ncbi:Kinesin-like protein [Rhynchospora pubera]|uniref:Kinesin-like protein n=1 Tax=Rhynchospora pubera TaxID=906938 RepID=A0AAV8DXX3_9POAL|nr:Kinesin-like protein [Rhynchospora pubera]
MQVQIGSHVFTYDYVYGLSGSKSSQLFEECVVPLVDTLLCGYNATVLAYGQTGSGKSYTMGTNYHGEANDGAIAHRVMEKIFEKVNKVRDEREFLIRVSFVEIFKEKVFDLLDQHSDGQVMRTRRDLRRVPIQIREKTLGDITLVGVNEPAVKSKEEMRLFLARGSLNRATASTRMNSHSSRSHAIFTIYIEQKRKTSSSHCNSGDLLVSKLRLVDLAGSERVKRSGPNGLRFKEGIHINKGLHALGNVINVLGDEKKRKKGAFVPYRDSKLTRLLQDSLGGNSKTIMIACISPADSNAGETVNTLKYANRARNIQNKAVINRNPVPAEIQAQLHLACSDDTSLKETQVSGVVESGAPCIIISSDSEGSDCGYIILSDDESISADDNAVEISDGKADVKYIEISDNDGVEISDDKYIEISDNDVEISDGKADGNLCCA